MRLALLFLVLCYFTSLKAQKVHNDNIENRHNLKINDKPYISHTINSTLQKKCLNLALTESCLIYHNDQWFEFESIDSGTYYLNIRNQECRNIKGVQAVIIKGEACIPESYELIKCISNGHQDDVYTEIALEANTTYLMIIDGYLHDYCYFDIDISTEVPDFAIVEDENTIEDELIGENEILEISWKVDSLFAQDIQSYLVLRRYEREAKSKVIWASPALRNALGEAFIDYSIFDTLEAESPGEYFYQVVALDNDSAKTLVKSISYLFEGLMKKEDPKDNFIIVELPKSKRNSLFYLTLNDVKRDVRLKRVSIQYDKLFREVKLDIEEFRKMGITDFELIIDDVTKEEQTSQLISRPALLIQEKENKLW